MPKAIDKIWNGRKVKEEIIIPAGSGKLEFGALYEATHLLSQKGFSVGWLDDKNPIGFAIGAAGPQKWYNLSKEEKAELDGVLVSEDFMTKDVKIILFI